MGPSHLLEQVLSLKFYQRNDLHIRGAGGGGGGGVAAVVVVAVRGGKLAFGAHTFSTFYAQH